MVKTKEKMDHTQKDVILNKTNVKESYYLLNTALNGCKKPKDNTDCPYLKAGKCGRRNSCINVIKRIILEYYQDTFQTVNTQFTKRDIELLLKSAIDFESTLNIQKDMFPNDCDIETKDAQRIKGLTRKLKKLKEGE